MHAVGSRAFARPLGRDFTGVRVAWCPDLGGLPLDRARARRARRQRATFEQLGCIVEEACPDLAGADEIFLTIRTWMNWNVNGPLLKEHRHQMKPEAIWDIEQGARYTGADVAQAMMRHAELLERVRRFQETYEFMLCAVNQVPPFDADLDWPKSIDGVAMENYVAWMKSCYWISATCRPAASVPAGFTTTGCPWASKSLAGTATISACCSSRMRSNKPPDSAGGARRSRSPQISPIPQIRNEPGERGEAALGVEARCGNERDGAKRVHSRLVRPTPGPAATQPVAGPPRPGDVNRAG